MWKLAWLACLIVLAACDGGDLISNPMVDRWCGERPCAWDVPQGRVKRVGTWHTDDYAVELLGEDTILSQGSRLHGEEGLHLSMIALVESEAQLYVELDFGDDGSVEFSERIRASFWERRGACVAIPSGYDGDIRFILRKQGPGRTVVANLSAFTDDVCGGEVIDLHDRPLGTACESNEQCASGACKRGECELENRTALGSVL